MCGGGGGGGGGGVHNEIPCLPSISSEGLHGKGIDQTTKDTLEAQRAHGALLWKRPSKNTPSQTQTTAADVDRMQCHSQATSESNRCRYGNGKAKLGLATQ